MVMKAKRLITLSVFSFVLWLIPFSTFAQPIDPGPNWPQVNRTLGRVNYTTTAIEVPFTTFQTYNLGGFPSGMTLFEGMLYVSVDTEGENILKAFDIDSGNELWSFALAGSRGSVAFAPPVQDSIILMGGQHAKGLYGLNRFTGDSLYLVPLGSLYARNAIIDGERIYISDTRNRCLYLEDGANKWSWRIHKPVVNTPAVDEMSVYHCERDTLVRTNKINAFVHWRKELRIRDYPSISLADSIVYVGSRNHIYSLRKADGSIKWEVDLGEKIRLHDLDVSSWSLTPESLILKAATISQDSMFLISIDLLSGTENWSTILPGTSYNPPLVIRDLILDGYRDGFIQVYDLFNGDSLYRLTFDQPLYGRELIVSDGKVFVGLENVVVALQSKATSAPHDAETDLKWDVYPNPTRAQLMIDIKQKDLDLNEIEFVSISGYIHRFPDQHWVGPGQFKLNVSHLPPGTYQVRLKTKKDILVTKAIIQ